MSYCLFKVTLIFTFGELSRLKNRCRRKKEKNYSAQLIQEYKNNNWNKILQDYLFVQLLFSVLMGITGLKKNRYEERKIQPTGYLQNNELIFQIFLQ